MYFGKRPLSAKSLMTLSKLSKDTEQPLKMFTLLMELTPCPPLAQLKTPIGEVHLEQALKRKKMKVEAT